MQVITVVGARPQFIKASPVSRALAREGIREVLVHTGQHYDHDMSQVFFDELGMRPPDLNLQVGSGSHAEQTAAMLTGIERAIQRFAPDCLLIYGDTNSTLAAALAAAKVHVPVAHVEAGLRSYNRRMPEEVNRIVADSLSDLLFAPTLAAVHNLSREGVSPAQIHLVGDVMYDAAIVHGRIAEESSEILRRLDLSAGAYVLATIHRAENTDDPARLRTAIESLIDISVTLPVVWPVHPRTRAALSLHNWITEVEDSVLTISPVGYLDMVMLEKNAAVIVTDSGGVQKEAFFHEVPCVTLRDETEWIETVELGWNRICPPRMRGELTSAIRAAIGTRGRAAKPYGDGSASKQIASIMGRA